MSIKFNDLKLEIKQDIEIVEWEDQEIEIKQYLPIQDKLNLTATIINDSVDDNGFYNPAKVYTYMILEVIFAYSNIELTENQRNDATKVAEIYDSIVSSGLSVRIFEKINPYEYNQIKEWVYQTIDNIYEYKNSVLGILDVINTDYKDADMNLEAMQKKLTESKEDIGALKDIMDKLG